MSSRDLEYDRSLLAQAYDLPVDASSGYGRNKPSSQPNGSAVNVSRQAAPAPHDARGPQRDLEGEFQKSEYGGGQPARWQVSQQHSGRLRPWYNSRKGKIFIAIIVLVAIVAAVVGGTVGGTSKKSSSTPQAPVQSETASAGVGAGVGSSTSPIAGISTPAVPSTTTATATVTVTAGSSTSNLPSSGPGPGVGGG